MSTPADEAGAQERSWVLAGALAVVFALAVWLWPIGVGGAMPVGGDVTQFSIGLMAFLAESLRGLRLPVWNDLWGYGFPGIGESQIGAYYPPHWVLYGLLPLEWGYTISLVAHTFWAGLGAFWAARRFGVSVAGATLAGWSWGASGFFVIHLPHQWAYTAGSWMPWVWGLGWTLLRGERRRTTPWLLAAALAIQVLPGHFQLAFITQVGLLILGVASRPGRDLFRLLLPLTGAVFLTLAQLLPTWRLARLAVSDRTFEYLGTFATAPFHAISYVVPGLFHRSPLWRSIVWDPFHSIPEESQGYVGLVPLFLAIAALGRVRGDAAVRSLTVVALVTLLLSWGPYVPGFGWLIQLPGFSFFRAPARWSVATDLALCLLAGRGLDRFLSWKRHARPLLIFSIGCVLVPLVAIGALELGLASTERPGMPAVVRMADRVLSLAPWEKRIRLADLMNAARQPQGALRERAKLAALGHTRVQPEGLRWDRARADIYRDELGPTAVLIAGLIAVGLLVRFPVAKRALPWALGLLTFADPLMLARLRTVETMPLQSFQEASPVLARLSRLPRGTRVLDDSRNLPMVGGGAPISAYRTLDLPRPRSLEVLARSGEVDPLAFCGAVVTGPFEPGDGEAIDDPNLASWLYGQAWVAGEGSRFTTFRLRLRDAPGPRAWLLPEGTKPGAFIEPAELRDVFARATPLTLVAADPQHLKVGLEARGTEAVLVASQFDPAWTATWEGPGGRRPAPLASVWDGWVATLAPGPGRWSLHLDFNAADVRVGLVVSALAWVGWLAGWGLAYRGDRRERGPTP